MPTANSSASKEAVTAALLVIGGKILSGRTKDQNGYIAEYLTAVGIDLKEVRVVGDEEALHHRRARADLMRVMRRRASFISGGRLHPFVQDGERARIGVDRRPSPRSRQVTSSAPTKRSRSPMLPRPPTRPMGSLTEKFGVGLEASGSYSADTMSNVETELEEVPCKTNPLGVKGIGEFSTIGAPPTVINALIDALSITRARSGAAAQPA
jgi:hypothetical protein